MPEQARVTGARAGGAKKRCTRLCGVNVGINRLGGA